MKQISKTLAVAIMLLLNIAVAHAETTILKGHVIINGKEVAADYTKLSASTVMLGTGQNACVSQYVEGHVMVPGEVAIDGTTYQVVEVSALAFRLCNKITSVEIKENVKRVGNFAFTGCPNIKDITLPASLESIGTGAFQSCSGAIESVTCLGTVPATWEYNDVFKFHAAGIGDNKPELITAEVGLFVPENTSEVYKQANYTNPDLGWTTADGWGSFNNLNLGQAVFRIYRAFDLESLRDIVNYGNKYNTIRKTVLEADIDMSAYNWDKGIGYREEEPFLGNFYGNGHTISNLHVRNENGPGGLFAYYGGHAISDLTLKDCDFFGAGSTGALLGVSGYCDISNVWVENTRVVGGDFVGGLVGKCLTTGGANVYHSVVKNAHIGTTHFLSNLLGGLVGYCYGGKARNCAIIGNLPDPYYLELGVLGTNGVRPFVGNCVNNNDYYVEDCYVASDYMEDYSPASYEKLDFDVVVAKKTPLHYTDVDNTQVTTVYDESTMKSMFMIPELGIDEWIYAPGEYPLPLSFADRLPVEVNKASYCLDSQSLGRLNALAPKSALSSFLDLSANGYRSGNYQAYQLWIDENFAYDPSTLDAGEQTPYLPIGTATISSQNGVRFDLTYEVTQTGTRPVTVPNAVVDGDGNVVFDEFGKPVLDGNTTTIYEEPVYAPAAHCIYLPYPFTVNEGVKFCQPVSAEPNDLERLLAMRLSEVTTTDAWQPYYMVLDDAPVNMSNFDYLTIYPKPADTDVVFGHNNEYRMRGTSIPLPASEELRYQLHGFDTFEYMSDTPLPAWTAYLTYDGGSTRNYFDVISEILLHDDESNDATIELYAESLLNVCLYGRTFYKDDTWYTLCLPFDVPSFAGTPLEGAAVRAMSSSSYSNGTLTIIFEQANSIQAGKPYLMKWNRAPKVKNPVFPQVTVRNVEPMTVSNGDVRFVGSFNPAMLYGGDQSTLYLGDNNQLFYPEDNMVVNACRAHFEVKQEIVNSPQGIRHIVLNFDGPGVVTDVHELNVTPSSGDDIWYTLDGRRLTSKPTAAGIYINQGKKIMIK